ncbi:protein-glutamate O-methyltransferase (plasmid) [Tritonibacter scottomollicae]|uniref:Chemotaxis protein methyltransferase n=1 Tax=Tritonibacter scottomollicae TaxID=483013 RepID=A0ABZ0H9A8_TRISK|nr:protein-glutamate O-methyltransferase [Tritonibacter scottomollicae]WOI31373.1 protein-glutamate O-methyltransferase [Tritonibacter scottomollicae]
MSIAGPVESFDGGGIVLSDQDFEAVAQFAYKHFGLAMSPSKKPLVSSRLSRKLRKQNITDFKEYLKRLDGQNADHERSELLSLLTTNVTQFFREPHHFETLRQDVLPPLIERAKKGGRVRIWSAGCSIGQEPYTIAAILHDLCPDADRYDIKILGTDIDPVVVRSAEEAQYPLEDFEGIPQQYKMQLEPGNKPETGRVPQHLRKLVTYGVLNLIQPFPFKGKFDAIFCRNVAIYFDNQTQQKVWQAFQRTLTPGGYLFIGHSERMSGPAAQYMKTVGITTYVNTPG